MAALLFILDALVTLVVIAFLLRLVMPLVRVDFRDPIGQAVLKFTNPVVLPLRRLFKPAGRVDVASAAALLLVQFGGTALTLTVAGAGISLDRVLLGGLRSLAQTVLQFYFVAVLLNALMSWVAPGGHGPALHLLERLCDPLLRPLRRVIPPLGGLDLTPLFVLIGLQALQILLR